MKSKTVLFLAILFLAAMESQAQPDCRSKYSPYYICQSNYAEADYIFYGEIVSSGKIDHNTSINRKSAYYRTIVEVKKTFKGNPPDKFEVFLDYDIICQGIPGVKSMQIFNVNKIDVNGQKLYYSKDMSRPLTDYSPEALDKVFNHIKTVLNNKKENILEGVIQETLDKPRQIELKNEELDKYIFSPVNWKPLSSVLIEATNELSGKTYSTKSMADGTYRIDNIPNGIYKIKLNLPPGKEQQTFSRGIDDSACSRKWNIMVMP